MLSNYKVYVLTNKTTGMSYVGVTKQKLNKRFKAGKGYKLDTKINKAIQKYGWDNFTYKVVYETNDRETAGKMEEKYIKKLDSINNGYNKQSGGFKNFVGAKHTEEYKRKMSQTKKGKHYSPETEFKKGIKTEAHYAVMKQVVCIETGQIYESISKAEKELNISHHITDCINGKRNQCGGYHWKLLKECE